MARELVTIGFLAGFAAALGLDVGFLTLGWVGSFVGIALLLPVSFSGLGLREGAYVVLLAPYGVSGSSALALAFLMLIGHLAVGRRRRSARAQKPGRGRAPARRPASGHAPAATIRRAGPSKHKGVGAPAATSGAVAA